MMSDNNESNSRDAPTEELRVAESDDEVRIYEQHNANDEFIQSDVTVEDLLDSTDSSKTYQPSEHTRGGAGGGDDG